METGEIIFLISGESYQKVRQYRLEMGYRVLRDQFKRKGRALIVRHRGQQALQQIDELPAMGEATPWYGDVGTGYHYTLRPETDGCRLKVENMASGFAFFCSEVLPPIELRLSERVQLKKSADGIPKSISPHVGYAFQENEDNQTIILSVTADIYPRLAAWPRYGEPLSEYEFTFYPLTVGNTLSVKHVDSSDSIDLTEEIEW